ncbi:MAG: TonB family protein [Woeseiaceae bacterium]|nr:TonB family protein [Woeseiaceae bacterium]
MHSEQSTLDSLSAGFNDRYTVHCATSGTEALNTLGEVPIHVIVSAQDLPGMSGVEALREAKKRSPETIGILLAGRNDKDVEALVGEKEVFQVIRGGVSGEELGKLIDNATRQMRLMALAESANDTRAVPEDTGEHIVMETAENGSSIITDATGSMPALDPRKAASATPGAREVDVLVLSKDEEFLATIRESTKGMHEVHAAATLAAAEQSLKKFNVGVVLIDAAMVGPKVEQLAAHLRRAGDRLVSIVAGRRDDGEMLMDLINRGKVYRFLLKPVSPGRARLAIEASARHHLEAPDSAFKIDGGKAVEPSAKPPKPEKSSKPAAAKPAAASPEPARKPGGADATARPEPVKKSETARKPGPADKKPAPEKSRQAATILPDVDVDLPDDNMDAFDSTDDSLRQTMSGLVAKVGGSLGGLVRKEDDLPGPGQVPGADGSDGGTSPFANPKLLGIGAVVLLVVAGAGAWLFGGDDDTAVDSLPAASMTDTAEPVAAPARADQAPAAAQSTGDELIVQARRLRDAGMIYTPVGDSAIDRFAAAAAAAPRDRELADEFADVVDQTLSLGEAAMLEGRVDDAVSAIGQVQAADPDNPRLPFLAAQLEQMQLREYLDRARAAILDSRFQDAANAIAAARSLSTADSDRIDAVAAELDVARSAERVEDVLDTAAARLDAGRLLEPPNDNARYYYELALSNDPGNATAVAGLGMIISRLVLDARAAIDAGNFRSAARILDDARDINAESSEVTAAGRALDDARQRDAERRAAAEREAASAVAEKPAAASPQTAAPAAASAGSTNSSADSAATAAAEAVEPATKAVAPDNATAAATPAEEGPVPISSLTRTKYVAPRYPRAAERRSLSGWVDVVFTVRIDGSVGDVEVRESEPGDVFVNAAIKAVEKWEFEPVIENDRYIEKQAGVRLMFAIE